VKIDVLVVAYEASATLEAVLNRIPAAALLIVGWHSVTTSRDALRYGTEGRHCGSLTHKL